MSFNQSRSDKNDSPYRKYGRSASSHQYRSSPSSSAPFGGKGAGAAPAPSASSLSSNRSFKKSNNAQGGGGHQSRANLPPAFNSSSSDSAGNPHTPRTTIQNGAHVQPISYGGAGGGGGGGLASDAPPSATNTSKQTEALPTQRSTRAVPKAPTSQSASMTSVNATPTTPAKSPGDASKAFAFQFGSISPGFMNGMQIPARTSSAPPNLDEQKRDQARHDAFRFVPPLPTPTPMQQLPRKDVSSVNQSNGGETHPAPKAKKETQPSPAPPVSQAPKPAVLPTPITSMPIPYPQPQGSVPFGGPNPQIQSQSVTATSLQMPVPMPIPIGNAAQLQQQMFVQGLQHHPMQHQGILHHGQSLSFTPTMGPQLPPQLGNLGMGITSQYPQQQGGKFGPRKTTVKITDPKTHEELRLGKRADSYADGGSSGLRVHPTAPPQSQLIPSFATSSPINYFPNSYNASNPFISPSSSQQIRCNYPVNQAPQNVSHMNSSALNPHSVNKSGVAIHTVAEPPNSDHIRDAHCVVSSASSGTVHVTVKPPASSAGNKIMESSLPNSSSTSEKSGSHKLPKPSGDSGSFPPQKDSESIPDSPFQQPKPGSDSSSSKSLLVPSKQSEATGVDSMISNSSVPALLSQPAESLLFATEGKRRESLSRSNSIKDHHKKSGKKGSTQPQHQIGGQSTVLSSSSSHPPEHGISSDGTIEPVETKTAPLLSSTASECFTESIRETEPEILASTNVNSETKVSGVNDSSLNVSSESTPAGVIVDSLDTVDHSKLDDQSLQEQLKCETVGTEKHGEKGLSEDSKEEDNSFEVSSASISSQSVVLVKEAKESALAANEVPTSETAKQRLDEPVSSLAENDDGKLHGDLTLMLDASSNQCESACDKEVSVVPDRQFAPLRSPDNLDATSKCEGEGIANIGGSSTSLAVSGSKDKSAELTRSKSSTSKVRKKRKEALQKADAAGTTSDLYMAYKGPEERKESPVASEITESTSNSCNMKQALSNSLQADSGSSEKHMQNKAEPDDWEDAADISSPKLETPKKEQAHGGLMQADKDGSTVMTKKYSRDFLLKFSEQCRSLPEGFEVTSDISEALMSVNVSHVVDRDSFHSPGRVIDRSNSRTDRRGSNMGDEERWSNKQPGAFGSRDSRMEATPVPNSGFRVGNSGVLKMPRGPPFSGGILTGPMPSLPSQGMQRNSPDADRWLRGTNFQQKGLIPSPQSQTPLQMMHKAEKKYEVGKVADQEDLKQRQLKAILNKLTPQNFDKLFEQVQAVNIDNAVTLTGVISQIFDKALMEPTFCEMYANFCYHLAGELPDFNEDNEKITFKRLLLNKCQEEFERGEREQEEANKADEEGEIKQSDEEREEKRLKARRRMLGNIRLIGELYKKKMLTERIMHECIKKLLGQYQNPDEEDIEALCKLMSTIGEMIDHPKAKEHMDAYFDRMGKLSNNMKLSSRVRFMLKDAIDLRKNKWQQRRKVEGPKKIEEVHRDAAQERQLQGSRLARNPSMSSARRAPMDFGPRGSSMLSSPSGAQMGGYRGLPAQARGYGTQDVRFEDRQPYDARTLSVALPQKPLGDEPITLGPQGGLARGMSIRGPPVVANSTTSDVSHSSIDSRRVGAGMNGFGAASDRPTYSPKEEVHPRHPDRFVVPTAYDQDRHTNYINRDPRNLDRGFDRSLTTSPPTQAHGPALNQNPPLEKVWPEERLRDMSMSAIREFYSARDEKEVALCITDLNSPSFHSSMIALWVVDSFERKDMERDLLAKLLVNLTRSQDGILSSAQLVEGFELVLTTLEDAVNDAPKAAEFLGHIFAKVAVENVVPLQTIGSLLHKGGGGDEPGRLLAIGLAGDVLGSTLEMIKSEKGEGVLKEIRSGSNLRLEDFRPPDANRSRILEKFI